MNRSSKILLFSVIAILLFWGGYEVGYKKGSIDAIFVLGMTKLSSHESRSERDSAKGFHYSDRIFNIDSMTSLLDSLKFNLIASEATFSLDAQTADNAQRWLIGRHHDLERLVYETENAFIDFPNQTMGEGLNQQLLWHSLQKGNPTDIIEKEVHELKQTILLSNDQETRIKSVMMQGFNNLQNQKETRNRFKPLNTQQIMIDELNQIRAVLTPLQSSKLDQQLKSKRVIYPSNS